MSTEDELWRNFRGQQRVSRAAEETEEAELWQKLQADQRAARVASDTTAAATGASVAAAAAAATTAGAEEEDGAQVWQKLQSEQRAARAASETPAQEADPVGRVSRTAAPEALVAACAAAAAEGSLAVFVDFDRTLTRCFTAEGRRGTSAHGVLEGASLLSQEFQRKTKELFNKYYPIEVHATMSVEEKIPIMTEWYTEVHGLMVKEQITRKNMADAVEACKDIQLRDGMPELLRFCQEAQPPIPVLIMSAGLGDVTEEFLDQRLPFVLAPTTRIVSNRLKFDCRGTLCGFSAPLLHMFNKNAAFFSEDCKRLVQGCKACLLLGDGVGDATMADGLECRTLLKVGFLNEKVEERLASFDKVFDFLVIDDGPVPEMCFRALGVGARWSSAKVRGLARAGMVIAAYVCIGVLAQRRLRER